MVVTLVVNHLRHPNNHPHHLKTDFQEKTKKYSQFFLLMRILQTSVKAPHTTMSPSRRSSTEWRTTCDCCPRVIRCHCKRVKKKQGHCHPHTMVAELMKLMLRMVDDYQLGFPSFPLPGTPYVFLYHSLSNSE